MRVVCAGLATHDTILRVPSHPEPDGRVVADELLVAGGGPAATAAVAVARLGVEAVFVGTVANDAAGRFVVDGLAAEGVDVSHVAVAGTRTPQSVILVGADGSRSIVHRPGDEPVPDVELDADWVHVDHAGYGHARGRLSVDGGNPIAGLDLHGVALYGPTEERLRETFGDAGAALDAGAELVVVTRGAGGSVATSREETVEAPGVPCDDVVSTLGAGDVFHGALLALLVRGFELRDALHGANAAASLSCRALDGRSAIPTFDELKGHIA